MPRLVRSPAAGPIPDHVICGGIGKCPELCIFRQEFASKMDTAYNGGTAGIWDVPETEGISERLGPETDREICGGMAEWCIFG